MTVLLILTVLVLVAISIWQITKIFELSQPKKVNTQVADDDDNRWNGQLMFAFLIFIYGITLFSFWKWGDVMLPSASSEHGIEYDNLLWISFAIIFFTQTITQGLLHYFAYKFRGEKGKKAFFSCLYKPGAINFHICIAINGNEKNKAKKKAIFNSVKKASCKAV